MRRLHNVRAWLKRNPRAARFLAYCALAGGTGYAVDTASHASGQLRETVRESAEARVITVTQRCELTGLIAEVIEKDDPLRLPAFRLSYMACEKQLKKVKRIAAEAP